MKNKIKCPICNQEFEGGDFDDCPFCGWECWLLEDIENPDKIDVVNGVSISKAKKNYEKGLSPWGDPLK